MQGLVFMPMTVTSVIEWAQVSTDSSGCLINVSYQCGMFFLFSLNERCCSKPPFASSPHGYGPIVLAWLQWEPVLFKHQYVLIIPVDLMAYVSRTPCAYWLTARELQHLAVSLQSALLSNSPQTDDLIVAGSSREADLTSATRLNRYSPPPSTSSTTSPPHPCHSLALPRVHQHLDTAKTSRPRTPLPPPLALRRTRAAFAPRAPRPPLRVLKLLSQMPASRSLLLGGRQRGRRGLLASGERWRVGGSKRSDISGL